MIATWGRPEQCELPPPPPGAPGPFALPDEDTVLRALKSTGFAVKAIETVGEEKVTDTVRAAIAPYRTDDGGYRLENVFGYLIAWA